MILYQYFKLDLLRRKICMHIAAGLSDPTGLLACGEIESWPKKEDGDYPALR